MKTTSEYIDLIKAHSDEIRTQFGVRTLRLFGSVSRGEHPLHRICNPTQPNISICNA